MATKNVANGFHPVYVLELFAPEPLAFDASAFHGKLTASFGSVTAGASAESILHYFLNDVPVPFKEGNCAAQILVSWHHAGKPNWNLIDSASQSRRLPAAAERLAGCPHRALLCDFMSSPLDHRKRRSILATTLRAAIAHSNVELVHFVPTMEVLEARETLKEFSAAEQLASPTYGFLNVRFFTVTDSGGAMIMDTLGLSALGLTDVQIHSRQLDPNDVARFMYSVGAYLFEHGDIIESGQTVQGIESDSKWRCQREMSLLEPKRSVIDVNPGPDFAAGRGRR